jgi:hypothetical protein
MQRGTLIRVRPLDQIMATLDDQGSFEGLPFMPEMKQFCGKEFVVSSRLEKTCVEGLGARLLPNTVTLGNLRCDGSAHDGCQRACTLMWKESWLEPITRDRDCASSVTEEAVKCRENLATTTESGKYFCQSTELGKATSYLFPITFKRCTAEYFAGNIGLGKAIEYLWVPLVTKIKTKLFGRKSVQPVGQTKQTPAESLGLKPGDWVEVKSLEEIATTLDPSGFNRGLEFSPQMKPFCGRKYRVRSRIERAILEQTGKMRLMKDTVLLENSICDGHTILGGCSRAIHHYWREIWLRRTSPPDSRKEHECPISG